MSEQTIVVIRLPVYCATPGWSGGLVWRAAGEHRFGIENRMMETETVVVDETPEKAAESIAAALDFLRDEADTAGLSDVGDLIQRASARARERCAPLSAADFEDLCQAIARLPDECRDALVFRKVYRRSCAQIASHCSVSVETARTRVIDGFRMLRAAL
ncbi:MAG: sigma factor-like helix-turn-helix DNA-binding protein [Woeseia sp.]